VRDTESPAVDYIYLSRNIDDLQTELFIEKKEVNKISLKFRVLQDNHGAENIRLSLKRKGGRDILRHHRGDYAIFENLTFGGLGSDLAIRAEQGTGLGFGNPSRAGRGSDLAIRAERGLPKLRKFRIFIQPASATLL